MREKNEQEVRDNLSQELSRGTLVLSVLLVSDAPQYGYSLVEELADRGITVEQNTLYPLLRRLESQGLLQSSWDTTSSRPRKYYSLSEFGKRVRDLLLDEWRNLDTAIEAIAQEKKR